MMKGKSNPPKKIARRPAGLVIKASLTARPNQGANPAADIFRAIKESETVGAPESQEREVAEPTTQSVANDKTPPEPEASVSVTPEQKSASDTSVSVASAKREPRKTPNAKVTAPAQSAGGVRVVALQPRQAKSGKAQAGKTGQVAAVQEQSPLTTLFERTKAKELYDLLYQLTLGAETPCSSVRVRRSDLMAVTNVRTRITLDLNLKRLEDLGLVKIESRPGEQEGNIYTVAPLPAQA